MGILCILRVKRFMLGLARGDGQTIQRRTRPRNPTLIEHVLAVTWLGVGALFHLISPLDMESLRALRLEQLYGMGKKTII